MVPPLFAILLNVILTGRRKVARVQQLVVVFLEIVVQRSLVVSLQIWALLMLSMQSLWVLCWLEYDSKLVVSAFTNPSSVLWRLQNRWNNCLLITANMQFLVSHIFREGNTCADKLAYFGLSVVGSVWWDSIPSFVTEEFFRNRNGLPNYRFR